MGSVTAVPYGDAPSVENVGTDQDQIWDIAVPTGATGVLTGDTPPTGSDGTSLGQLYYCTANQSYYSLIELNENDNKWRPFMTQDTAIRKYDLDIIHKVLKETAGVVCGYARLMFDDVQRKLTVNIDFRGVVPIEASPSYRGVDHLYISASQLASIKADAAQRGISAIPFDVTVKVNNVPATATINLLGRGNWVHSDGSQNYAGSYLVPIKDILPPSDGTGSVPSAALKWEEGRIVLDENRTAAPGATEYGDMPINTSADTVDFVGFYPDAEYAMSYDTTVTVVVPYV